MSLISVRVSTEIKQFRLSYPYSVIMPLGESTLACFNHLYFVVEQAATICDCISDTTQTINGFGNTHNRHLSKIFLAMMGICHIIA